MTVDGGPRKYPQKLRDRAVRLALGWDRPIAQIAADLVFLIDDLDVKFNAMFDEVFRAEGIRVVPTTPQGPSMNAHHLRKIPTE
jgi:hypothetical protein